MNEGFKPYPAYKASGVEWLGEVPEGWEVARIGNSIADCQNGVWGDEPTDDGGVICVRVADFDRVKLRVDILDPTYRSIDQRTLSSRRLNKGDLLLEKSGGGEKQLVGAVMLFDHDIEAVCSNFVARMPVVSGFSPAFLTYLHFAIYSGRLNYRSIKQNTGIQNLDSKSYLNEVVAFPPLPEQHAIAAFLDHKTAEIDALIAAKERLIALLREKRAALITSAVTKGLDPDVAMKDSGVEWLGEVPEGWEVKRLKFMVVEPLKYGANEAAKFVNTDHPRYIRITDITEFGELREDTFRSLPPEVAGPFLLEDGDVLFARSGATVGKVFRYEVSWGIAAYAGYLIRARLDESELESRFLIFFTQTTVYWDWLRSNYIQATIQNVSAERYANLLIPNPPLPEQHAIAAFLDRQTAGIDALVGKVEEAIDRLKEYRTALISAAVTGKIDVREEG